MSLNYTITIRFSSRYYEKEIQIIFYQIYLFNNKNRNRVNILSHLILFRKIKKNNLIKDCSFALFQG